MFEISHALDIWSEGKKLHETSTNESCHLVALIWKVKETQLPKPMLWADRPTEYKIPTHAWYASHWSPQLRMQLGNATPGRGWMITIKPKRKESRSMKPIDVWLMKRRQVPTKSVSFSKLFNASSLESKSKCIRDTNMSAHLRDIANLVA